MKCWLHSRQQSSYKKKMYLFPKKKKVLFLEYWIYWQFGEIC